MDDSNFYDFDYHTKFIQDLKSELTVSDDVFVNHHKRTHSHIYPFWVIIEVTTFGVLSKLFKNMLPDDRTYISKHYYGVHREYIENWLQCSVLARNIAAHGGRFYNRQLYSCPVKFDRALQGKIFPVRPFAFIFAINKLLPDESYKASLSDELSALFSLYPLVQKNHLGFPEDWIDILENA